MKQRNLALVGILVFAAAVVFPTAVMAQRAAEQRQGTLSLGIEIGPQFGTADSTAFGLGFSGDYFLNQNFSVGPLLQMGVTDDFFQFGPSVQLKYTYDVDERLKTNLQGGFGFLYAELERRGADRHDTSFLIPFGPGVEYRLGNGFSVGGTLLFNITNLDFRGENFFVSLLGGLKVRF
jgi:hypothetical protein